MAGPPRKKKTAAKELPREVRARVDRLLIEGATSEDIAAYLADQGYDITKTAIGRYGREFMECMRKLRIIEEKSLALAADENMGLVLEEAASRLFAQRIIEEQLEGKIDMDHLPRMLAEFAKLQSSSVLRERLRRELRARVEKTAEEVEQKTRKGGLSDDTIDEIKRKILGITE